LLFVLLVSGCTPTTKTLQTTNAFTRPAGEVVVLVMPPDVQLGVLTASGMVEPRADWTETAKANIERHVRSELERKSSRSVAFDTATPMTPEQIQLIRLHEAVGGAIITFKMGLLSLPTKKDLFDWSLGPGVRNLAPDQGANYALFLYANGSYASGGRVATAVVMGVLFGAVVPTGQQSCFASLVDLSTGDIVWFNTAASQGGDLRDPTKSRSMIDALLATIPI
jgi:hypothetical protein